MTPEAIWRGDGAMARLLRAALMPGSWLYSGAARARNQLYDGGTLRVHMPDLPTISVGNLSVGGTGKTPVASWLAEQCVARGVVPGVVLRGYGGDEVVVHETLCADARVVPNPDRLAGIRAAKTAGAGVAILDDGFQHRRVARVLDLVLISADAEWAGRCLPAGPLREPPQGLGRADLVIVTRKIADAAAADAIASRALRWGARQVVHLGLEARDLRVAIPGSGAGCELAALRGQRVLAISGIGDPRPFHAMLRLAGARTDTIRYPDHHPYSAADVGQLVARARDADFVVCTLKDAVKLRALWPRSGPVLMYVSQRVVPAESSDLLMAALDRVCTTCVTP